MDLSEEIYSDAVQYCFPSLNSSCLKEQSTVKKAMLYFLISGLIMMTLGGNITVIIAIAHFRQLHTPTNFLILSLALDDFLIGAIVMPFSMISAVENCWYFGDTFCYLSASFFTALTVISIFHLIFIAVDRYFAICDPLHYSRKITNSVAGIFIVVSWVVPQIYAYSYVFSHAEIVTSKSSCTGSCVLTWTALSSTVDAFVSFFIPCSVMLCLYAKVFLVAKRHSEMLIHIEISQQRTSSSQQHESKAAKTLTIVMGVYLLCWLPIVIVSLADPYINYSTPVMLYKCLVWLAFSNSAYNPIIYAFFYPWFQKALKLIATGKIFTSESCSMKLVSEHS
ncbi:trace amine-associated receptor 4-like [Protopterus annectens]|uniref:trace amine-associated receptor 4-like n=1 Tax=Protopterus annectens TaxID=7888 RepID=UPI001CFA8B94|nr:trace amine-associated receptor 4-like [Protopterus annectens]